MRMSSQRLALLYIAMVTLITGTLLGSVYLLTRGALERETATIVHSEMADLADDLRLGGLERVVTTLRLRRDSWGRTGAVFLLADADFQPVAGNLSGWPRELRRGTRPESAGSSAFANATQTDLGAAGCFLRRSTSRVLLSSRKLSITPRSRRRARRWLTAVGLSDTARAVVWLHDVEGYTHDEIATMMGKTTSFSKSQLARAHRKLRGWLGEEAIA